METYEDGGHAYHATMPTDALIQFRDAMRETEVYDLDKLRGLQIELGKRIRELLSTKGIKSVAAEGFQAPGVIVSYTGDANIQSGKAFAEAGIQIAAGVPLQCDEGSSFKSFRLGLFGLEKLKNIDRTIDHFEKALNKVCG